MREKKTGENETFLDDFIPYVMYRITNRMNMDLQDCLRPQKINVSRWRVLCALHAKDGRNMSDLCTFTMMEQSSVSRVIDSMEKEKLVTRKLRKNDNRYVLVYLTTKGRDVFTKASVPAFSREDRALEGFSEENREQLLDYLNRILDNIREDAR
ncbi:MAG TPA: MarR family transcriptional regulator [Sphingomonadales bacterium]|nr:MarR family transcriptional regulator [Sphingomonadales bacterium]